MIAEGFLQPTHYRMLDVLNRDELVIVFPHFYRLPVVTLAAPYGLWRPERRIALRTD